MISRGYVFVKQSWLGSFAEFLFSFLFLLLHCLCSVFTYTSILCRDSLFIPVVYYFFLFSYYYSLSLLLCDEYFFMAAFGSNSFIGFYFSCFFSSLACPKEGILSFLRVALLCFLYTPSYLQTRLTSYL